MPAEFLRPVPPNDFVGAGPVVAGLPKAELLAADLDGDGFENRFGAAGKRLDGGGVDGGVVLGLSSD